MAEIVNADVELSRNLRKAVRLVMAKMARRARQNVSGRVLSRRTGEASKSIRTSVRKFQGGVRALLRSTSFYIRYFELTGAAAHSIPKDRNLARSGTFGVVRQRGRTGTFEYRKALLINGQFVRRQVQHPGVQKQPVLQPAVDDVLAEGLREVEDAMAETLLKFIPRTIQFKA